MAFKEKWMEVRNQNAKKVERLHKKRNVVAPQVGNSLIHEVAKFIAAYNYKKEGCEFYDEAKFTDKSGFADLYVLDMDWAVEVLHSESDKRFERKKYPVAETKKLDAVEYVKEHLKEFIEELREK